MLSNVTWKFSDGEELVVVIFFGGWHEGTGWWWKKGVGFMMLTVGDLR